MLAVMVSFPIAAMLLTTGAGLVNAQAVVAQPAAQPAPAQPAAAQPAPAQPAAAQPAPAQPAAAQPAPAQPAPVQPAPVQPAPVQPAPAPPAAIQPGAIQPGAVQPGAAQPAASQPAAAQPADSLSIDDLVGTWSSKSNSTLTGPGFYDPAKDSFTEPKHTGISYSFTSDGAFEEAYYRAVANPSNPKCPQGIIQWQHGKFEKHTNGSLTLSPIAEDGRQLYSDPCTNKNAVYTRYNASEIIKHYEVIKDPSRNIKKLTLFKSDGAPMMPLYLAMTPPQMLPTTTLNPLSTATAGAKANSKVKRALNHMTTLGDRTPQQQQADWVWWFGVCLTATGSTLYFFF